MVPSSFADVTRALYGCFREGFVYVSLRFVGYDSEILETSHALGMSSLIFELQAKALRSALGTF